MVDHTQGFAADELDLRVINTLQIAPRAPWSRIAAALELDPVTVARRWYRLSSSGAAWVTAHTGHPQITRTCIAFVEVDCDANRAFGIARTLARWPHVLTVEHTTGSRDLLLTVAVPSQAALSRYLLQSLGTLPGVRVTRSYLITGAYAVGGDWRLRALAPTSSPFSAPGPARTWRPRRDPSPRPTATSSSDCAATAEPR